jgi:uncharacterized membrane protein YphA (DoxX/SURF4 family)
MRRSFRQQWFEFGIRLFLGCLFIYASLDKIYNPPGFAETIGNYRILPQDFTNLTAVILPWLELVLGFFLIFGIWLSGATFLTNLLLTIFWAAILFNHLRGLDISCGCFRLPNTADPRSHMLWYIARDSVFLLICTYLSYSVLLKKSKHRKS